MNNTKVMYGFRLENTKAGTAWVHPTLGRIDRRKGEKLWSATRRDGTPLPGAYTMPRYGRRALGSFE